MRHGLCDAGLHDRLAAVDDGAMTLMSEKNCVFVQFGFYLLYEAAKAVGHHSHKALRLTTSSNSEISIDLWIQVAERISVIYA